MLKINISYIMKYPCFTVIIPQKNRAEFLVHTIRTCMIQDYPNFEIIVSDDCSEDNSVEVVEELCKIDSRIRLFAHKEHLGMRDNFEFALSKVRHGYVIALGGDDGLLPGCIWKMYHILKETKKQLLTWPLANFSYASNSGGKNIYWTPRKTSKKVKIIKSEDFLNKIAETFVYQIKECPMFYMKGVASTELVDRVRSRTQDGCFYYCPTPDGFSGVVLAGEVEDYVYYDEPLTIGGVTHKSQGQNYRRTDKKSKEEAQQFFNDNIRRMMHKDLASQPYSPLETLMTADYLLTAKGLPGWPGKFKQFTIDDLLKKTFKFISTNNFENETLMRELNILREIAVYHDKLDLFNNLMHTTKRKIISGEQVYGFALTNSVRLDGHQYGIDNIFDAAIATNFISQFSTNFSWNLLWKLFTNTIKILLRQKKYKIESLPDIN